MGKYLRKAKPPPQVALMDVSQSTFGVRTRAKTLALQRLPKSSPSGLASPAGSASYLQLRSRRLEKPPIIVPLGESRRQKQNPRAKQNARLRGNLVTAEPRRSASLQSAVNENEERSIETAEATDDLAGKSAESSCDENCQNYLDLGAKEASFGENDYGFDDRERGARESPPCSSTRDPDSIRMPGSTSRSTNSTETNRRLLNRPGRRVPTSHEMDKFFTGAEEEQQRQFIEKYNFDPVQDKPLPGRYEWEKLGP